MVRQARHSDLYGAALAIRFAAATRFECWCLKWLHDRLWWFLAGAERAEVDGGLDLGLRPGGAMQEFTEQLFKTVHGHESELRLLPLDCKTVQPRLAQRFKGGLYHHHIQRMGPQKACAAFIVHSLDTPNDVALIPMAYLTRTEAQDDETGFYGREIPLTGAPIEPFPLEWSPFVMPLELLPTNLGLLREFALDDTKGWRNTHNGITFEGLKPLRRRKMGLLLPSGNSKTDHYEMRHMWDICRTNGNRFRLERPVVQPSVADFVMRDTETNLTTMVELKRSSYKCHGEKIIFPFNRYTGGLCLPWNVFDHLLVLHPNRKQGYIFSRNEIPHQWQILYAKLKGAALKAGMTFVNAKSLLDSHLSGGAPYSTGKLRDLLTHLSDTSQFELAIKISRPDRLDDHQLNWTDDESFAKSLDEALLRYQEKGQFRASRPLIPRPSGENIDLSATDEETASESAEEGHEEASEPQFRGSGQRWSPKQFAATHQETIEKQLQTGHLHGRLIYLGLHPCGSFAYVPKISSTLSFHDLSLDTPLSYVNMATIELEDRLIPTDGKRTRLLLHVTHGVHESIYLIAPRVKGMQDPRLKMYVLPSWILKIPQRVAIHEKLLDDNKSLSSKRVFLLDGDCFENYACSMSDVAARIDSLTREHTDRLVSNKRHAVEYFFRLYVDDSFHRLCTPMQEESETEGEGDGMGVGEEEEEDDDEGEDHE